MPHEQVPHGELGKMTCEGRDVSCQEAGPERKWRVVTPPPGRLASSSVQLKCICRAESGAQLGDRWSGCCWSWQTGEDTFLTEGARVGAGSLEPSSPHRVPHMRVVPPAPTSSCGREDTGHMRSARGRQ